ncbi:MAG: transmembrane 220 family protein [Acidiferrobacterales bacterium]
MNSPTDLKAVLVIAIRVVNIGLTLLFVLAMAVQFNDPDPLLWVTIYGLVVVVAGLAVFSKYYIPLILILLVICAAGSLYLMPSVFELFARHDAGDIMAKMAPDRPYIEEARESLGLLIAAIALAYFYVLARKSRRVR